MSYLPVFESKSTVSSPADVHVVFVFQAEGKKPKPVTGPYGVLLTQMGKEGFKAEAQSSQFLRFGGKGKAK